MPRNNAGEIAYTDQLDAHLHLFMMLHQYQHVHVMQAPVSQSSPPITPSYPECKNIVISFYDQN